MGYDYMCPYREYDPADIEDDDTEPDSSCFDAMEWLGSMLDSIDALADNCVCTFKEAKKDNTTEWVLECDYYTVTITLQEKPK
jgi:hypothetical protein